MEGFVRALVLLFLTVPPFPCVDGLCYRQPPDSKTIKVDYQIRRIPSEDADSQWELEANVTWQRRQANDLGGGYAVRVGLNKDRNSLSLMNCSLAGLLTTDDESYLFTGLHFGYEYFFGVSFLNNDGTERVSMEAVKSSQSPDCYQETGDKEFCSTQSVESVGVPLDFQVDCVAPSLADEEATSQYTAVLSWTPPIQVNGNISDYELRYGPYSTDLALQVPSVEDTKVYIKELLGLEEFANFTAMVRAFVAGNGGPKVYLKFNTFNEQLASNLSHDNEICKELDQNLDGTTFPRTTGAKTAPSSYVAWLVGLILALIVVSGALILCFVLKKRKTLADSKEAIFVRYPEDDACRKGTPDMSRSFDELREPDIVFQSREIDRSLLTINEKLGSGQFGIVYSGVLSSTDSTMKKFAPRPVAVKSLKLNATRATKEDFLDEIKLIIDIGSHPNILAILGCCTVDEPYYLITEFMKYGDLLGFLWKCKDEKCQAEDPIYCLTEIGQLQIARQIARGMEYLSNTRYYHGDLAARNVLVGEGLAVKVSDFGMADDIYQRGYKRLGQEKKRPLKWVSLETNTKGTCSIKSDVWSFGIVLYEIYTLGGVPYPGMDGFEVVRKLEDGYRMEQPHGGCPDEMYIVMLECWHENPDLRPTFTALFNKLDRMLSEQSSEYFTELDFDDKPSQNSQGTNYGFETNRDDGHYDTLKAVGWSPVPRVTVECVDNVKQVTSDVSKC